MKALTISTNSSSLKKSQGLPLTDFNRFVFQKRIVDWFEQNARDLPWRKTSDPYKIWVSEVMLQQTQVSTVIPYYLKFLEKFPDIQALAKSSELEVMQSWQGLGYYRRAKNLRLGAQFIFEKLDGKFPKTKEDLLEIPGIGNYSAGSILSIAHSIGTPALDGNLIRVYSRYFGIREAVDDSKTLKRLWEIAEFLVPPEKKNVRAFTEGMMELGALICSPKSPKCLICPLHKSCVARMKNWVDEIPLKSKKIERKKFFEEVHFFKKEKLGKIALLPKGADPKFPDFQRLPYRVLNERPKRVDFRYSVTVRDFEIELATNLNPKLFKKLEWVKKEELSARLLPAIDRKIISHCLSQFTQ